MSTDERKEVKKCGLYTTSPVQISHLQAMSINTKRHGGHKITVKFAYRDRNSFLNLPEVFVFSTSWTGVYSSQHQRI